MTATANTPSPGRWVNRRESSSRCSRHSSARFAATPARGPEALICHSQPMFRMTILARTAALAALSTLVLVPRLGAQSSKITVTIGGGAHAGTYEMPALYCDMHADQFPPIDFEANSMGTG